MRDGTYLMFLLSESTVLVVTLRVWFHGPAGEEVTHCTVANILRYFAKLEEIPGDRRRGGRREEGERRGGRREKGEVRGRRERGEKREEGEKDREEKREEGVRREEEEERWEKGERRGGREERKGRRERRTETRGRKR